MVYWTQKIVYVLMSVVYQSKTRQNTKQAMRKFVYLIDIWQRNSFKKMVYHRKNMGHHRKKYRETDLEFCNKINNTR